MTREARVTADQANIFAFLDAQQKEFIDFVLSKYIETGVGELDQEKLPILLTNKYHSLEDAKDVLGNVANIRNIYTNRLLLDYTREKYLALFYSQSLLPVFSIESISTGGYKV